MTSGFFVGARRDNGLHGSMVNHLALNEVTPGSIPGQPTKLGRASAGSGGDSYKVPTGGFDSHPYHQRRGSVAQIGEQQPVKLLDAGASPAWASKNDQLAANWKAAAVQRRRTNYRVVCRGLILGL